MKPRAATLDPATLRALANELDAERERAEGGAPLHPLMLPYSTRRKEA